MSASPAETASWMAWRVPEEETRRLNSSRRRFATSSWPRSRAICSSVSCAYSERWKTSAPVSSSMRVASRWPSRTAKCSGGVYQNSALTRVGSSSSIARSLVVSPSRAAFSTCQIVSPSQRPVQSNSSGTSPKGRVRHG